MKFHKKFCFWLTLIAVGICLINLLGHDDKSILLFLTSPPFWILENMSFRFPIGFIYIVSITFWFLFGFGIDKIIKKLSKKERVPDH